MNTYYYYLLDHENWGNDLENLLLLPIWEGKRREKELGNIAKNAMQAYGINTQMSPYSLAIADIHGNLCFSPKSQILVITPSKLCAIWWSSINNM